MCLKSSAIIVLIFISCNRSQGDYAACQIIGHGANGLENTASIYHDNTAQAIALATERIGCSGVELDVQLSADGSLWLFHDELLDKETSGKGSINDHNDAYLDKLEYATIHREKLVCLSKTNIDFKSKTVFLDLKHLNSSQNKWVDLDNMLEAIRIFKLINKTLDLNLITNNYAWLPYLLDLDIPVFVELADVTSNLSTLPEDVAGVVIKNRHCSADQVNVFRSKGKKVVIFEVRSPKWTGRALEKQPDYLITDDIRVALIEKER